MKYIFNLLVLMFFVGSCSKDVNNSVERLNADTLEKSIHLDAEVVDYDFFNDSAVYGKNYLVYNDSILIIAKRDNINGCLLSILDLKTKKDLYRSFNRGNGHNEILGIDIRLTNNNLIINDWVKQQVVSLSLDSILINPNYQVDLVKHSQSVPIVFPLGEGVVYANPMCFSDRHLGIRQSPPQFPRLVYVADASVDPLIKESEFFTGNVAGGGNIVIGDDMIVYMSPHQSYLEFYHRNNMQLFKKIEGPLTLDVEYAVMKMGNLKNVVFKRRIPYSYTNYCCDDNYIYVTYIGDYLSAGKKMSDLKSYILKFSWDGELIKTYSTDYYLFSISKGKADDVFYATTLGKDDNPYLIKLSVCNYLSKSVNGNRKMPIISR